VRVGQALELPGCASGQCKANFRSFTEIEKDPGPDTIFIRYEKLVPDDTAEKKKLHEFIG